MLKPQLPPGSVMLCHLDDEAARKNGYDRFDVYDSLFWHLLFCGPVVVPAPWILNNESLSLIFGESGREEDKIPLSRSAEVVDLLRTGLLIPVTLAGTSNTLSAVADRMRSTASQPSGMLKHVGDDVVSRRAELIGTIDCIGTPDLRTQVHEKSRLLFSSARLQNWLTKSTSNTQKSNQLRDLVDRAVEPFDVGPAGNGMVRGVRRSKLYELLEWNDGSSFAALATDVADTAYYLSFQESLGVALALPGPAVRVCAILRGAGDVLFGHADVEIIDTNVPSPARSGVSIAEAIHELGSHPVREAWLSEYRSAITNGTLDIEHNSEQIRLAVALTRLATDYLKIGSKRARTKMIQETSANANGKVIMAKVSYAGIGLAALSLGFDLWNHAGKRAVYSRRDMLKSISILGASAALGLDVVSKGGRHFFEHREYSSRSAVARDKLFTMSMVGN